MSRGFPAFFRQFWLHLRKNLRKNLYRQRGQIIFQVNTEPPLSFIQSQLSTCSTDGTSNTDTESRNECPCGFTRVLFPNSHQLRLFLKCHVSARRQIKQHTRSLCKTGENLCDFKTSTIWNFQRPSRFSSFLTSLFNFLATCEGPLHPHFGLWLG